VANTFITRKTGPIARTVLEALYEDVVLGRTVYRDAESEFGGGSGDTVNVKLPPTLSSRTTAGGGFTRYSTPITYDDITQTKVAVVLDTLIYHAAKIPDEDATYGLEDFMADVGVPQSLAVADGTEDVLVSAMEGLTPDSTIEFPAAPSAGDYIDVFADARKALRDNSVPTSNLYAAVSTGVATELLKDDNLRRVDASGTDGALRDAIIGRVHGFTVVESNKLTDGNAVFYHRDAFALVTRAPQVPLGAGAGMSLSAKGFSVTWTADYDPNYLADRSVVRALAGAKVLDANRAVLVGTASA
jgi:hypothetical protein